MSSSPLTSSIAIIGAGDVGATIAYSLILNPIARTLLLVDPQEAVRDAQVQDLSDATYHGNSPVVIRAGTHKEAGQCDIIIMAAGAKQKKGESRTDLIGRNKSILESAINDMKPLASNAILLVVANPVDVLTFFAQRYAELPAAQVFGSGTFLDTARLRGLLAAKAGVAASAVDAYVLGEHGESQVVAWSRASVAGVPLAQAVGDDVSIDQAAIADEVKNKAAGIIENKGATNFGIGGVVASLCRSILADQRDVRPVSHWQEALGVCLSMPATLGRKGVLRTVEMGLSGEEKRAVEASAKALKEVIEA
jgi:L-lactate dehydrogenase